MANVGRFFERSHEREITAVRFHFFPSTLVPALVLLLDTVFFSAFVFFLRNRTNYSRRAQFDSRQGSATSILSQCL